jgi:signal peptidase I
LRLEGTSEFVQEGGEGSLSMEALVELTRAVTEKGKSFRFQALGFSMYPFIRNGDYITISPFTYGHPRLGDVVAFIQPETEKMIVHRIVENRGDHYLIKGDNTTAPDGLIPKANVLGYVTKVDKDGKLIRLGSGFEKVFIALLSRKNLLRPGLHLTYTLIGPIIRRIKT